jgi:hypothetical protein
VAKRVSVFHHRRRPPDFSKIERFASASPWRTARAFDWRCEHDVLRKLPNMAKAERFSIARWALYLR